MRAMVYVENGVLEMRDVPDVSPGAGEVKLRIRASGICGSDIPGYLGISGRRIPPMIMGHEFSGQVVALGENAGRLGIGDRVSVYPHHFCGACAPCRSDYEHMCVHKRSYGVLETDGAFAEFICVPEKCCFPLADGVSYSVGSMMEPLAVGYRAVRKAGNLAGKTVFLVGAGTIGLMALACVLRQKPSRVFVSDISDLRLEYARKMGADIAINASRENVAAVVSAFTQGKGVDVAIESVGASPSTAQTIAAAKHGGTVVWVGMNKPVIEASMMSIVTKELQVVGTFLYNLGEFAAAVGLINRKEIDISSLISREEPLENGPAVFAELSRDAGKVIKVVLTQN